MVRAKQMGRATLETIYTTSKIMDQAITAVIGAVIFAAFTAGLAESIGAPPFIVIVILVICMMGFAAYQVVREGWNAGKSNDSK